MNRLSTIKLWAIIAIVAVGLGCNVRSEKKHKYNSCDFFQHYDTPDSSFNLVVDLADLKYNELSPSNSHGFYGAFKGVDAYRKTPINIVIFETVFLKEDLDKMISHYEVVVETYQSVPCYDFYSSFDLTQYIDKRYPIVMGKFMRASRD